MIASCGTFSFRLIVVEILLASSFLLAQPGQFEKSLQGGLSRNCPSPDLYSTQRPDPQGTATPVSIGIYYADIQEIIDSDQTFTVDAWLIFRWKDFRLADESRGDAQALCSVDPAQLWMPRAQIRSLRDFESTYADLTLIDAEGNLTLFRRGRITVFSRFDLRDFPFDTQHLALAIESLYGIDDVEFHVWDEMPGVGDVSVASWRLSVPASSVDVEQGRLQKRAVFSSTIEAYREPNFFARKLIVPVGLIVFMAYAVFWISPSQIAPQTGTGATAMLTLIAYQFAMSGYLPRISYLTRADFFLLWSLVLVFVALMEAIATAGLMNYGKEQAVRTMDKACRILYPLAFMLILVMSVY